MVTSGINEQITGKFSEKGCGIIWEQNFYNSECEITDRSKIMCGIVGNDTTEIILCSKCQLKIRPIVGLAIHIDDYEEFKIIK